MAATPLDERYQVPMAWAFAGPEYLRELQKLGFDPDALFVAYDDKRADYRLFIIARAFDVVGPLRMQKTLFSAYKASLTPKVISPFSVTLHSPRQRISREIIDLLPADFDPATTLDVPGTSNLKTVQRYFFNHDGIWVHSRNFAKFDPSLRTGADNSQRASESWQAFENEVLRRAA